MKSKRTGRDLPFIKVKCDNPKPAEALISGGLICQKTGIMFKVKEFRITPSIQQCFKCQGFRTRHKIALKNRNVLCVVKLIHTKTVQIKTKKPQNVQTVGGPCRQLQKLSCIQGSSFQATCGPKSNSLYLHCKTSLTTTPNNTFNFTAKQIVSLVTNVVSQIAQPQLCTKNLPEKQVQAKSDLSKQIAETAKKCLGVSITGKDVFEFIISWPAPPPPCALCFQLHAG